MKRFDKRLESKTWSRANMKRKIGLRLKHSRNLGATRLKLRVSGFSEAADQGLKAPHPKQTKKLFC